jgi:hypothetical protein
VQLLPGKLVALFDVRLQQWRAIEYLASAKENGMKQAYRMLAKVKTGTTLVLADLGYFSFRWFDELTDLGKSPDLTSQREYLGCGTAHLLSSRRNWFFG